MAGLLAYAAEGAVAGAGKGLEQVGAASLKDQMDQGIVRLQNQYASTRQQAEFAQQSAMQGKQQSFEKGLKEEELERSSRVAGAQIASKEKLAGQHEAGATERAKIAAKGRVDAALAHGEAAAKGKNAPKPWQVIKTTQGGFDAHNLPTTNQIPLLHNPNTGALYAPVGDKLIRWDASTSKPAYDPKSLNRNVDQGEIQRLYADPNGIIPQGKAAGMTNIENFERLHHYLPAGIQSRLTQGGMVNENNPIQSAGGGDSGDGGADNTESGISAEDEEPAVEP